MLFRAISGGAGFGAGLPRERRIFLFRRHFTIQFSKYHFYFGFLSMKNAARPLVKRPRHIRIMAIYNRHKIDAISLVHRRMHFHTVWLTPHCLPRRRRPRAGLPCRQTALTGQDRVPADATDRLPRRRTRRAANFICDGRRACFKILRKVARHCCPPPRGGYIQPYYIYGHAYFCSISSLMPAAKFAPLFSIVAIPPEAPISLIGFERSLPRQRRAAMLIIGSPTLRHDASTAVSPRLGHYR